MILSIASTFLSFKFFSEDLYWLELDDRQIGMQQNNGIFNNFDLIINW